MRKPLAHYNEFMNYVWRTWKMLKGKSNPWLSCPRFPLPIPSRGKFRKHWGPRLNQKQILQKNPRRGQRSQYLKLSHQHQLLFQEKKRSKKATKRCMDSSSSSNNSSASSLPDQLVAKFATNASGVIWGPKGLATLIASVKLQKSCQVGVLPDTRKCYNSDQITCANGY